MTTSRRIAAILAAVAGIAMLVAGPVMIWKGFDGQSQVKAQLSAQKISFDSDAAKLPADLRSFAGQQVVTGDQAKAYADMVEEHVLAATGGKTYSEVSGAYMALPDKTTADAQKLGATRQTAFMGESLRGSLMGAYQAWQITYLVIGLGALVAGLGVVFLAIAAALRPRRVTVPETPAGLVGHPIETIG